MRDNEIPPDVFGLPAQLTRERAVALVAALEETWIAQSQGGFPLDLRSDLTTLGAFFDPLAREATLRRRLEEIEATPVDLPLALALDAGNGRRLMTPEGRVALELLRTALATPGTVVAIEPANLATATAVVADFYRMLSRKRLDKVRQLAAGEAKPMLPVAAAFILLLLVNRSTSVERALDQIPGDPSRRAVIDDAFAPALRAFATTLTGQFKERDRTLRGLSLYQGYALTEARRRLGSRLCQKDTRLWIAEEDEADVLAFLARDLTRRADSDRILAAFDALVENYRTTMPRVANLQFAHERPAHTDDLRRQLERMLRVQ
jgi:hypothetical protein